MESILFLWLRLPWRLTRMIHVRSLFLKQVVAAAEEQGIDFAIDIYPHYGSDADAALDAGYDIRHALIGAGVYASHGYERSHIEGVRNTFELLKAYLD